MTSLYSAKPEYCHSSSGRSTRDSVKILNKKMILPEVNQVSKSFSHQVLMEVSGTKYFQFSCSLIYE